MSDESARPQAPTARRAFLGQLATVTAAFAATACASGTGMAAAAAAPAPSPATGTPADTSAMKLPPAPPMPALEFDDAWASLINGRHRAVFDSPAIEDGTAVFNAYTYMQGYKDMYHVADHDVNAVIVMRHMGIPMAFDDEIWARFNLGKFSKVKEPGSDNWATRNPFWKAPPGHPDEAAYTLDALQKRGVVLLGCALATRGFAGMLAQQTGDKADRVFDELRRHLITGLELQPSGIFAVMRAQEAGCHYIRST